MIPVQTLIRPLRVALFLGALAAVLQGCASASERRPVDVASPPPPTQRVVLGEEVGRLLSHDQAVSARAAQRLRSLTDEDRDELIALAQTLPDERDPRWLAVLDDQQALPELKPEERLRYALWRAEQPGRSSGMRAQSLLLELARTDAPLLIRQLETGGPQGRPRVVVALGQSGEQRAVLPILELYLRTGSAQERRASAESIAWLLGEAYRPRTVGSPAEMRADAARIRRAARENSALGTEPTAPVPSEEYLDG